MKEEEKKIEVEEKDVLYYSTLILYLIHFQLFSYLLIAFYYINRRF